LRNLNLFTILTALLVINLILLIIFSISAFQLIDNCDNEYSSLNDFFIVVGGFLFFVVLSFYVGVVPCFEGTLSELGRIMDKTIPLFASLFWMWQIIEAVNEVNGWKC